MFVLLFIAFCEQNIWVDNILIACGDVGVSRNRTAPINSIVDTLHHERFYENECYTANDNYTPSMDAMVCILDNE